TGEPPFEGETAFSILYKHKTEPLVSPRVRWPALSERTSELIERCLAKAPVERFASFAEILKHLHPASGTSSPWVISDDSELATYQERYRTRKPHYLSERRLWNEDLDVYTFPRGQCLRILRGDLVMQKVDALVNSDTCCLDMDDGVSAAIREAGGP